MRYYVVSVLPELFESFVRAGLVGKAVAAGTIGIETISPREFARDRHRTVDDAPYGGGSGMVMQAAPLLAAMAEAERREAARGGARPLRVLLTPQGTPLGQERVRALAGEGALTLVCGRYEGVDERARDAVDVEISIGDFVLMGGEVAAMAVIEATARLVPGVLGNPDSVVSESHSDGLLEHPHYTRPEELDGARVPDVLLSGHHERIAAWRHREALRRTLLRRPDLLTRRVASAADAKILDALRAELAAAPPADHREVVLRSGEAAAPRVEGGREASTDDHTGGRRGELPEGGGGAGG